MGRWFCTRICTRRKERGEGEVKHLSVERGKSMQLGLLDCWFLFCWWGGSLSRGVFCVVNCRLSLPPPRAEPLPLQASSQARAQAQLERVHPPLCVPVQVLKWPLCVCVGGGGGTHRERKWPAVRKRWRDRRRIMSMSSTLPPHGTPPPLTHLLPPVPLHQGTISLAARGARAAFFSFSFPHTPPPTSD